MIRLDAISITSLPQVSKADVREPYAARVNCVLHSGQLSEYQKLEVLLNGVPQNGVHEGDQVVFAWQFLQASDEIRIYLLSRGRRVKHWQGCWNERDAILHTGTLSVQVFFDGKPQLFLDTMIDPVLSAELGHGPPWQAETVNGRKPIGTLLLESNHDENRRGERSETSGREQETVIVQDLLIIAASKLTPDGEQEKDVISEEDNEGGTEEIGEDEEELTAREDDTTAQWEDGFSEKDENEREEDESQRDEDGIKGDTITQWREDSVDERIGTEDSDKAQQVNDVEVREAVTPHAGIDNVVEDDERHHPARNHATGRCIASFHASPLVLEKTLQSLRDLMAMMPSKTLIVDVRPKESQKKKYQEQAGLSKQLLRSVFGAKYWDRVWAIRIMSQMVPSTDKVGISTWHYVVDTSDNHPDGIRSLVQKIEEGYSIVVIDSIASYRESRRRAVIDELQQRVPDLDVGFLG